MGSRLTQDEILEALRARCKERGQSHTFAIKYYNNANDSAIQVNCLEHNRSEVRTYRHYTASRLGMRCCATAAIQRSTTLVKRQQMCEHKVLLLANTRGHTVSEVCFRNRTDFTFTISCKKHHSRYQRVHYKYYTSTNTTYGVPCCAYPIRVQPRSGEKEREQISNRLLKWKRQLCPNKQDRWLCPLTHRMSWGRADSATIHGHHLYGGEGYPSLRYLVNNGVLLNQAFHLEFHKTVRKADTITPTAFLLFLEHLLVTDQRLLLCLQKLREQLQSEGWFENCKPCKHPITGESAYLAFSKRRGGSLATPGQLGGAYLPAWLIDEIETGVSQVSGRVATMASDVRHRIAHLNLCLHDQALAPSRERGLGPLSDNLVKALPVSLDAHPFINYTLCHYFLITLQAK